MDSETIPVDANGPDVPGSQQTNGAPGDIALLDNQGDPAFLAQPNLVPVRNSEQAQDALNPPPMTAEAKEGSGTNPENEIKEPSSPSSGSEAHDPIATPAVTQKANDGEDNSQESIEHSEVGEGLAAAFTANSGADLPSKDEQQQAGNGDSDNPPVIPPNQDGVTTIPSAQDPVEVPAGATKDNDRDSDDWFNKPNVDHDAEEAALETELDVLDTTNENANLPDSAKYDDVGSLPPPPPDNAGDALPGTKRSEIFTVNPVTLAVAGLGCLVLALMVYRRRRHRQSTTIAPPNRESYLTLPVHRKDDAGGAASSFSWA